MPDWRPSGDRSPTTRNARDLETILCFGDVSQFMQCKKGFENSHSMDSTRCLAFCRAQSVRAVLQETNFTMSRQGQFESKSIGTLLGSGELYFARLGAHSSLLKKSRWLQGREIAGYGRPAVAMEFLRKSHCRTC
jgi:hypothetical protein